MKEALKLALEALDMMVVPRGFQAQVRIKEIYDTIKEILAQPEQPKVRTGDCLLTGFCASEGHKIQKAEPEQEPVAYFNPQVKGGFYWAKPTKITAPVTVSVEPMPLYTTPPQRTWVGLTDEEDIDWDGTGNLKQLVEAVEAKLKAKNHV